MKRRTLLLVAAAVLLLGAVSAVSLADFGGDDPVRYADVVRDLPGGSSCVCPQIWAPVLCRAADGTARAFSNACVAGCYGFAQCARVVVLP